jgi:3-dehydroquinate synthase
MHKVRVKLGDNSYTVHIGAGLLAEAGSIISKLGLKGKAVVITNPDVGKLYSTQLQKSLKSAGFNVAVLTIPEGEEFKTLDTAGRLYLEMAAFSAERNTPVLALGGGVIGDLAGFVAATYMRGVPFIQIPTTLLAQVDSSVGGKVAVDHAQLKNMVGTFYQPKVVIADVATLKTLPPSQLSNGLSEAIKHGIIKDARLFAYFEKNMVRIRQGNPELLEHVVAADVRIKADIVSQDERDTGLRHILNFGHTVGHAVESVTNFEVTHGEAVSIGMIAACRLGVQMDLFNAEDADRVEALLQAAGLKTQLPPVDLDAVMDAMRHDKKMSAGKIKFILPKAIGEVIITDDVNLADMKKVLVGMR